MGKEKEGFGYLRNVTPTGYKLPGKRVSNQAGAGVSRSWRRGDNGGRSVGLYTLTTIPCLPKILPRHQPGAVRA